MALDTLEIFGDEFTGVAGFKATDDNNNIKTYIRPDGTLNVTSSGTKDVTNYASASIPSQTLPSSPASTSSGTSKATISRSTSTRYLNIPTGFNDTAQYYTISAVADGTAGTPTATKGTVSNHSVSVTPSVTNTTGYITGSTKTGTAVTVSASELVSGSETKTQNGTYNVTNLAELVVNVSGGGGTSKETYVYMGLASRTANSYGATNATVTVSKAGTYTISYVAVRGSSQGAMGTNLHIGSTSGTNNTTWNKGTYGQSVTLTGQSISANTAVTIYATSASNSRTIYVGNLIVKEE